MTYVIDHLDPQSLHLTTPERRQVQHFTDFTRRGNVTMCGVPLPPFVLGPVLICPPCEIKWRRRLARRRRSARLRLASN